MFLLAKKLRERGFHLANGKAGQLTVTPGSELTTGDRAMIAVNKPELLNIIKPTRPKDGKLSTPREVLGMLCRSKLICLDLETTGLNPRKDRIRLLSLADGNETLVMDCFEHPIKQVIPWLRDKILVAHNAMFDLGFLWRQGLTDIPKTVCTWLAAELIEAGTNNKCSLSECAKRYLGEELSKEQQLSDWSGTLTTEQIEYSRRDAAVLVPLLKHLGAELEKGGLLEVSDIEMSALPAFVWLSQSGVPFDKEAWEQLHYQTVKECLRLTEKLDSMAPQPAQGTFWGHSWDWDSPQQVQEVLNLQGFPVATSCDAQLAGIDHPIAAVLRDYRAASKKKTSYGLEWLGMIDGGRIYPSWRQLGTATGRTSCKEPNLQQMPREDAYRNCVKAPEGRTLVKADFSQIQLRVAAKISGDKNMAEIYRDGGDIHTVTAQRTLGKQDVTKADRQIAKSQNFALVFAASAEGLRSYAKATYGIDLSPQEAENHRAAFFQAYPGLANWHRQAKLLKVKETRGTTGRRRLLPDNAPDTWRLNSPVQADESCGLKRVLALLWQTRSRCPSAIPVLVVHDEITLECDDREAAEAGKWLKECMEDGMRDILDPVPVVAEVSIRKTWGG